VEVSIKADSVDTHNTKRNDHLKSQDFFNVGKFPTLSFTSKSIAKAGETTFDVTGDMTIHGQTKPVTLKLEKTGESKSSQMGERVGYETVFTVKRSDYGMTFMPDALGDEVRVMIALEAAKK
jgi:polyisoprenoid-binding protein YceI